PARSPSIGPTATAAAMTARARGRDPLVVNGFLVDPADGHVIDRVSGAGPQDVAVPSGPGRYQVADIELDAARGMSSRKVWPEAEIVNDASGVARSLVRREEDGRTR